MHPLREAHIRNYRTMPPNGTITIRGCLNSYVFAFRFLPTFCTCYPLRGCWTRPSDSCGRKKLYRTQRDRHTRNVRGFCRCGSLCYRVIELWRMSEEVRSTAELCLCSFCGWTMFVNSDFYTSVFAYSTCAYVAILPRTVDSFLRFYGSEPSSFHYYYGTRWPLCHFDRMRRLRGVFEI